MRQRPQAAPCGAPGHEAGPHQRVDGDIARAFELLGKRWTGPIVSVLIGGPAFFGDLRRAIPGISERMLSDRLTELGAAELVVREVHGGPPLRVSYRLSEAGAALEPVFTELARWARAHLSEGEQPIAG
ncbi:winged helix-turn-helix transcriptional regulator [Streptomyces canus]|uniref:winged helix-turn-helix transcriptional regulator n=1 Tax=Streptomyces canus TaxID=58343 RepID=UPI0036A8DE08